MATDLIKQYLQYAAPYAKKYNLDPWAMMAVAHAESGLNPGSIGDNGQSFGYHQFYTKGAGGANARQYLDPAKNVEYAARLMAQAGASGLKGQAAIDAMVRKFERPANPTGEVQRALQFYNQNKGGSLPSGGSDAGFNPAAASAQVPSLGQGSPLSDSRDTLMQLLMSQNGQTQNSNTQTTNLIGMLQNQKAALAASQASPSVTGGPPMGNPNGAQGGSTGPSSDSYDYGKFNGSYPLGAKGNLIGTPYAGTHSLGNWQSDNAIDISAKIGTPIIAVEDGVIGNRIGALGSKGSQFAGLRVNLEGKGNNYYYAHLSKLAVKAGDRVRKGQVIGYSGSANGVGHLHIGVEHGDPRKIFKLK